MAAFWSRIESFIFGGAVARAGSESVTPVLEPVRQKAWKNNTVRVLDVGSLGELAAKGFATTGALEDEAARSGYSPERLAAMEGLAQSYPGTGELNDLSNRAEAGILGVPFDPALIDKALSRHGIPGEYHAAIKATFADLLSPGEVAAAIHRGLVPDPGLLKGEQPSPPFNVEAYPVYPIDPVKEVGGHGLDKDRLGVLVGLQGLPMGVIEAAQAYWRGILTHGDYIRAFNESNNRNEWADAVLQYSRQIPTARDFFENALRGHHTFEWATQQAARHGMTADDALVIYQNQGRPINLHQISQAIAWGAHYHPGPGDDPDPYMQSVLLGPVRPEYYEMQDSLKYIVPSAFALRSLQQNGALTPDEAFVWYKRLGWEPGLARKVADAFHKTSGAAAKEATVTDLLTLYDGGKATRAETLAAIEALGYPADEAALKVETIAARRVVGAKQSAIGDLHTDFKKQAIDRTTAENALQALGEDAATATQIVDAWQQYVTAAATAPTPPPV